MKVKMTRTERATHKAQKAAKVAYKASKAPAITEFFWDEKDYMSPEELFWVDLDAACAAAQAPWDVKEQIAEYAKGSVHLKDNTVGQVIDGWLVQSYAPSWALTLDLYVGTYLPLVSYTIDIMTTYGTEIGNLESKAHDVVRSFKEVPTEVSIDYYVLAYVYYAKIRVTELGDFASFRYLWEKCEFSLHADKYQIASNRLRWWAEERADVHEYVYGSKNGRYDFIGNTSTVMEAFNGFHIDVYKALEMTAGLTREQLIDLHLQGKIRMIKKHSIYPRDVFEAYGLPGYVPFLEDYTKFIGFELISRWIGSSKYPVLVSETCYGITDAFCDWMVNFTGTMTSVKNHEPKGFYRYLDNKHEKAFFFPSYFCQTVPVAHDEKWCYDHDEYLKKARAVRGPVDEPCDPYEWDNEYNEDIDF